jgi:hypothetical protein
MIIDISFCNVLIEVKNLTVVTFDPIGQFVLSRRWGRFFEERNG